MTRRQFADEYVESGGDSLRGQSRVQPKGLTS